MIDDISSSVEVRTLDNGLSCLLMPDRSAPAASVQLWVRAGSMFEGEYLGAGISHLLEHMVFKGTRDFAGPELAKAVQDVGGNLNAYTAMDRTVYYVDCPAEGWRTALEVVTQLGFHPLLDEEEFEREKDVIRREIAMDHDDPGRTLLHELFACTFPTHPCRHPVIGHLQAFDQLTIEDVRRYHALQYAPDNAFLVVVGDIGVEEVWAGIGEAVGAVSRRTRPPVVLPVEPRQLSARTRRKPFATSLSKVRLAWRIPSLTHPDAPALDVLARILGDGRSSRLYRVLREDRELCHSVDAWSYTPAGEGLFVVGGECEPESRPAFERGLQEQVDEVVRLGVRDEELAKARRVCLAEFWFSLSTMSGKASQLGGSYLLTGGLDLSRLYLEAVERTTAEKVREVASRYLIGEGRNLVSLDPADDAGAIAKELAVSAAPEVHPTVFGNHLNLLFQSDPRLPLVFIEAVFRGGVGVEGPGQAGLTRWLSRCLLLGTGKRPAAELMERIESVGGSLSASSGNNTLAVSLSVLAEDLPMATELLGEVLQEPAFPEDACLRERHSQVAALRESLKNPATAALLKSRAMLYPDHPFGHSSLGTQECLEKLGTADLKAWHERHVRGTHGVVAVFGDIREKEAAGQLQTHLGGLPDGRGWSDPQLVPTWTGRREYELSLPKKQAVLVVSFPIGGVDSDHRLALEILDEACSDMASRLFYRIRESQGLAYFVGTTSMWGVQAGMFSFYLGTEPASLDHAQAEMEDEIAKICDQGLDAEEFDRACKTYRGKMILEGQSACARARRAAIDEAIGLGYNYSELSLERVRALRNEDVVQAAREHFARSRVIVRVVPE